MKKFSYQRNQYKQNRLYQITEKSFRLTKTELCNHNLLHQTGTLKMQKTTDQVEFFTPFFYKGKKIKTFEPFVPLVRFCGEFCWNLYCEFPWRILTRSFLKANETELNINQKTIWKPVKFLVLGSIKTRF